MTAYTIISGYWIKPVYQNTSDPNSRIIGSKIFYVNHADFGDGIPAFLKNTFAPKAMGEAFSDLSTYTRTQ